MGEYYLLEDGQGIVLILLLIMATKRMVGRKVSARDGRSLSIRGWPLAKE